MMKFKKINFDEIEQNVNPNVVENSFTTNIEVEDFDIIDFHYKDIDNLTEKEVRYMESMIRKSYEYSSYITYLKEELDITTCSILDTININDLQVSLEFHHYPFNLYTIVNTITKFLITVNNHVSLFDIAEVVMKEHYNGNIGLVPLTTTMHQLAHSNNIKIPFSKVYGNHEEFVMKYRDFIDPEALSTYDSLKSMTTAATDIFNNDKLEKNVVNYNIKYNHD